MPIVLLAATAACHSWRTESLSPATDSATLTSRVVRLTLLDGTKSEVVDPKIAHDTLRGWNRLSQQTGARREVVVPVSQIQVLEAQHVSAGKTALALGIPISVGLGIFLLAINAVPN